MFVSRLLLLIFLHLELTAAKKDHGPGYKGCYEVDQQWLVNLQPNYSIAQEDACLILCRHGFKRFALISIQSCFCADEDPSSTFERVEDARDGTCNENCTVNAAGNNTCVGVYKDIGFCSPLEVPENGMIDNSDFSAGVKVTFFCLPGYKLNGSSQLRCEEPENDTSPEWSHKVPTCEDSFFTTIWFRIIIDVAAVVGVVLIIIIIFLVARHIRRRRRGIFHHWKPHVYRSANLAAATLRSEGNRVHFQNQASLSVSAPISVSQDGQGSSPIVEGNANAISTPEIASGSAPVPAHGEGAPADIQKRNSEAVLIAEMHTSATAAVVSEKRDQNKANTENSAMAISPTSNHEQQGFTMSPVPKEGRPGSISKLDADEPKSSNDARGSQNTTMDRVSLGSIGSEAISNSGAPVAVKPAVRPKSSAILSETVVPSININGEKPSPVNAAVHQKNATKDEKATPSSSLQNNRDSNLMEMESTSLKTEDNLPMKEPASVINRFKLTSSSLRASKKPKVAKRRHTLQPEQIDSVAPSGAISLMVSKPAMADEQPGMNGESDGSSVGDAEKDYCSLRVGPLDNHPAGRESKPASLEEGAEPKQQVDRRVTVVEMDDEDYAQLRVEKSDACDHATTGRPESEIGNPADKKAVEETSTYDPYEIVWIGNA